MQHAKHIFCHYKKQYLFKIRWNVDQIQSNLTSLQCNKHEARKIISPLQGFSKLPSPRRSPQCKLGTSINCSSQSKSGSSTELNRFIFITTKLGIGKPYAMSCLSNKTLRRATHKVGHNFLTLTSI